MKMLSMPFCAYLVQNLDDLLLSAMLAEARSVELDVGLNEFDGAVSAGGHAVWTRREPVNHGATSDEAEDKKVHEERKIIDVFG